MCEDPSVFCFDNSGGIIYGPTDVLRCLPLGPGLPAVQAIEGMKYKPFKIYIAFAPKKNIFYKCKFRLSTGTSNYIDFILKGNGSYLEEHMIDE